MEHVLRHGRLSLLRLLGVTLLGAPLLAPPLVSPLVAQGPPAVPVPADAPYPGILEVPADTGRMVHGWHDFSRYGWGGRLGLCVMAAHDAQTRVWRHGELDTSQTRVHDTLALPPAVTQVATRCGLPPLLPAAEQQVLQGAPGWNLSFGAVYDAALLYGRDSATTPLLHAAVAHAPTRELQLGVVSSAYGMDLETHPLRAGLLERDAALAESLFYHSTAGDSLPPALNATPRTAFATVVLNARSWQYKHWLALGDTAQARAGAERFLAANTALAHGSWTQETQQAFFFLLHLEVLAHGVRSKEVVDVLTRMARYATKDSTARGQVWPYLLYYGKPFVWPATPYWYSATGAPVQPPASGGTSPAGAIVPGKVTLIWDPSGLDHRLIGSRADNFAQAVGYLHKLLPKFAPQGLQLVVLEHTRGMVHGVGAVDQEQEAPALRQQYQERFGLPAAVVLDTVRFRLLPDGRRNDAHTDWEKRYYPAPLPEWRPCRSEGFFILECFAPEVFLLDKHGRLRMLDWNLRNEDTLLELFIQQALQEP